MIQSSHHSQWCSHPTSLFGLRLNTLHSRRRKPYNASQSSSADPFLLIPPKPFRIAIASSKRNCTDSPVPQSDISTPVSGQDPAFSIASQISDDDELCHQELHSLCIPGTSSPKCVLPRWSWYSDSWRRPQSVIRWSTLKQGGFSPPWTTNGFIVGISLSKGSPPMFAYLSSETLFEFNRPEKSQ